MPLEVRRRRLVDVGAAFLERAEAAIEPLGQIRDRAAEMAERPADLRIALHDAAEDQLGRAASVVSNRKPTSGISQYSLHRLDADRIASDGSCSIAPRSFADLVDRPEPLVVERDAVDVAEEHRAGHLELAESRA